MNDREFQEPIATNGRAFLNRVRADKIPAGQLALWYIGGAGYIVRTATTTLLVDPFLGPSNPPDWIRNIPPAFAPDEIDALGPIDALLITHEHGDHADPVALAAMTTLPVTPVLGPQPSVDIAIEAGIGPGRAAIFPADTTRRIGDLTVTAVAMYDPAAQSANGYLIETGDRSLFLAGDSLYFPGFQQIGRRGRLDAICLSVGSNPPGQTIYLDEAGAARAARDSGANTLIVQHFDLWRGMTIDPARVRTVCRWYAPETRVVAARFQRRLTLGS